MKKVCCKCGVAKLIRMFPLRKNSAKILLPDKTIDTCKKCRYGIDWDNSTKKEKQDRMKFLLDKYVVKKDGCWEWTAYVNTSGYGTIDIDRVKHNAHRVSWIIYNGNIPKGKYVCHKCDNRTCTNPDHLFLGSPKDNMQDMLKKGRDVHLRGEDCPWAILTEVKVLEILKLFEKGFNAVEVGKKFNIDRKQASDIKRGRRWGHIGDRSKIKQIASNKIILNSEKVIEIKKQLDLGVRISVLSKDYNVSPTTISDIKHERTWKNVKMCQ